MSEIRLPGEHPNFSHEIPEPIREGGIHYDTEAAAVALEERLTGNTGTYSAELSSAHVSWNKESEQWVFQNGGRAYEVTTLLTPLLKDITSKPYEKLTEEEKKTIKAVNDACVALTAVDILASELQHNGLRAATKKE